MKSVKQNKASGKFQSLQKVQNSVTSNVLNQSFLRYAYGLPKETFRLWFGGGPEFQIRVPHNKNKNVIADPSIAKSYFSPKRLFMKHEMEQYGETPAGKIATNTEKKAQREFLKAQFQVLPADILQIYQKASRDKLTMHGFVEEVIVNTLNDNNEQAFRALEKVGLCWFLLTFVISHLNHHYSMSMDGAPSKPLSAGSR
jgi:hypothetical protein